jgi:hypothetical protein
MASFPRTEAEIIALAQNIAAGLRDRSDVFPAPPADSNNIALRINDFLNAQQTAIAAQATAQAAVDTKDAALDALTSEMRVVLRYAEQTTNGDDAKLKLLGWGGRATSNALQPAGQCRALEAPRQGDDWLFRDWKEPVDGGKVAAYKVQRRERPSGTWSDVTTALASEATLVDQQRGTDFEYRVVAINKAGEGLPSNSVAVVL